MHGAHEAAHGRQPGSSDEHRPDDEDAPGRGPTPEPRADHRPPRLSDRDLTILAFERQWLAHAGAKEQAIRVQFGVSAARYYQLLGALIDSPDALVHDPMLVKRLQRMREARAQARRRRSLQPQHAVAPHHRGPDQAHNAE